MLSIFKYPFIITIIRRPQLMSDFRHSPSGGAFVRICGKVETVLGFVAGHLLAVGAFRQTGAFTGAGTAGARGCCRSFGVRSGSARFGGEGRDKIRVLFHERFKLLSLHLHFRLHSFEVSRGCSVGRTRSFCHIFAGNGQRFLKAFDVEVT